jgi:hypothetical protein
MKTLLSALNIACSLMLCFLASGCGASKEFADPIKVMLDRSHAPNWRVDAAKQAEAKFPRDPARIDALNHLLWDRGQHESLRIYAIDQFVQIDEADLQKKLERRIVLIPPGPTIEHLYKVALERKWKNFSPTVVKRWAVPVRGIADKERPDRKMLAKLNPGKDLTQVVFNVFSLPPDQISSIQRAAAWSLLNRLATKQQVLAYLAKAPDASALVIYLKAAAKDLHIIPRNQEGVRWLYHLKDPASKDYWNNAKSIVAKLSPDKREGLALRHIAILAHANDATLAMSKSKIASSFKANDAAQKHYMTAPVFDDGSGAHPQRLYSWTKKLTWADYVTMTTLWQAVSDPKVKAALFAQADADQLFDHAEYGGVIDKSEGQFVAKPYTPILRLSHNRKFVPSNEMVEHCYTALAHYHFHAQEYENKRYAGPGFGDRDTAGRMTFNFLVFTFIDKDRLNVDYYREDGVAVDLGTIAR